MLLLSVSLLTKTGVHISCNETPLHSHIIGSIIISSFSYHRFPRTARQENNKCFHVIPMNSKHSLLSLFCNKNPIFKKLETMLYHQEWHNDFHCKNLECSLEWRASTSSSKETSVFWDSIETYLPWTGCSSKSLSPDSQDRKKFFF